MFYLITNKVIIFQVLYIVGICSESISGTIAATRKKMDWFGVTTIAIITALGGGTVRDLLLNNHPIIWISHPEYIIITLISSILSIIVIKHIIKLHKLFLVFDALGLVTFAYLGSDIGYKVTLHMTQNTDGTILAPLIISVVMAIITGASGGILRDMLCNDIPLVFQAELYAIVAAIVGLLNTISMYYQLDYLITTLVIILIGLSIRLIAIFYDLHLPKIIFFK